MTQQLPVIPQCQTSIIRNQLRLAFVRDMPASIGLTIMNAIGRLAGVDPDSGLWQWGPGRVNLVFMLRAYNPDLCDQVAETLLKLKGDH